MLNFRRMMARVIIWLVVAAGMASCSRIVYDPANRSEQLKFTVTPGA